MTLDDIFDTINDSTIVEIFQADTAECIGTYDGKAELPERYNDCDITDIFTGMSGNTPTLCIELDVFSTADFYNENAVCPCDIPDFNGEYHCPYNAEGSDACRHYCGCGVDE